MNINIKRTKNHFYDTYFAKDGSNQIKERIPWNNFIRDENTCFYKRLQVDSQKYWLHHTSIFSNHIAIPEKMLLMSIRDFHNILDSKQNGVKIFWTLTHFRPVSAAFHVQTSHLICNTNQITGSYMKCNNDLKRVKCCYIGSGNEGVKKQTIPYQATGCCT